MALANVSSKTNFQKVEKIKNTMIFIQKKVLHTGIIDFVPRT